MTCQECLIELPSETRKNKKYCDECRIITRRRTARDYGRRAYAMGKRYQPRPGYIRPDRATLEDGTCEICAKFGPLCRDHDNICCTGRFGTRCGQCERGGLCRTCNSLLGMAKDSINILTTAIKYLEVHTNDT